MGKVECRHRHIVDTGLTLLAHAGLDFRFWHYAFETTVFLINRLPSSVNPTKSPFELPFHRTPDYSFLRSFGCLCFQFIRPYQRHKMSFRSTPSVFLGYSPHHNGYRCLCLSTNRIFLAKHVQFHETTFPLSKPSLLGPSPVVSQSPSPSTSPYASASLDPRGLQLPSPSLPSLAPLSSSSRGVSKDTTPMRAQPSISLSPSLASTPSPPRPVSVPAPFSGTRSPLILSNQK